LTSRSQAPGANFHSPTWVRIGEPDQRILVIGLVGQRAGEGLGRHRHVDSRSA
jgi:hypothetical protein